MIANGIHNRENNASIRSKRFASWSVRLLGSHGCAPTAKTWEILTKSNPDRMINLLRCIRLIIDDEI